MAKKDKQLSFIEEVQEKFGDNIVEFEGSDEGVVKAISTGSLSLDVSLGTGGIPLGRITTIFGPESSAKTSLALTISKNAVNEGFKVLYIDVEQAVDYRYMKLIVGGISEDKKDMFVLAKPMTAEQSMTICEMGIRSGEFGLVVLDSIGALAPEKELDKELGDRSIGLIPTLMSSFLRRNAFYIREKNVGLILINQVRANIGKFIAGVDMPGGHALKHFSSIILQLWKADQIKIVKPGSKAADEEAAEIIGAYSRFTVKKNKLATPFKSAKFPLIYGKGIEFERDVVEFAEMLGVLEKRGSYYAFEGEVLAQGMLKVVDYLKEHKEVLDNVVKMCYNIVNSKNIIRKEELEDIEDGEPTENLEA